MHESRAHIAAAAGDAGRRLRYERAPRAGQTRLAAKHNGVIPAPHHSIKAARYLSDGYQMTRRDPLPPRRRELRYLPDGDNLAPDQDLAGILSDTEHDAAAQSRGNQSASRRSSHSSSMPERHRRAPRP